jgi:hypothetical protein
MGTAPKIAALLPPKKVCLMRRRRSVPLARGTKRTKMETSTSKERVGRLEWEDKTDSWSLNASTGGRIIALSKHVNGVYFVEHSYSIKGDKLDESFDLFSSDDTRQALLSLKSLGEAKNAAETLVFPSR